jgi:cupin 2 domain-containing protein
MVKENFFEGIPLPAFSGEHFDTLFQWGDYKIERILSNAHSDSEEHWYDQDQDEWVMLIRGEARLLFENEEELTLTEGDYLFIPAHKKHRVTYTSTEPACYWLAIHGILTDHSQD